jgi:hypothetical protein
MPAKGEIELLQVKISTRKASAMILKATKTKNKKLKRRAAKSRLEGRKCSKRSIKECFAIPGNARGKKPPNRAC